MTVFPLLRHCAFRELWRNRNLLEPSIHIDNMLALCHGAHTSLMLWNSSELERNKPWKVHWDKSIADCGTRTEFEPNSCEKARKSQIGVVNESLMYQMSDLDPEYMHLEQSMTFLGCSIESLRSSLARWVASNPDSGRETWTPAVDCRSTSTKAEEVDIFKFEVSDRISSLLNWALETRNSHTFERRFAQMRLLWELQNYFQRSLPETGVSACIHKAMIMCVLSFSALRMEVDNEMEVAESERNGETQDGVEDGDVALRVEDVWNVVIRAVCAPQDVFVKVSLKNEQSVWSAVVQVSVGSAEEQLRFEWEA